MRRRGNKSTKVPNVKLRPAQPQASSSKPRTQEAELSEHDDIWAQDSQLKEHDICPRPFYGFVLCATGVMDKPGLFRQAVELGAATCNAFTDRVTHLIAVNHGGPKYMCALERKIPILKPEWITENYQIWLRGDDVDIAESIRQYHLPIFSDVVLCLSGISDVNRRSQINKLVNSNGGSYLKNLERPVRVTHLLCSGDEETEKMHYAEKFNKRGEADIKLVWEEWFWDSLQFGGRFDEDKYQVRRPRPQPRSFTNVELPTATPSSSSPLNVSTPVQENRPKNAKGRLPESQDNEDEPAVVQRLPATQLKIWASLLKHRGYAMDVEQGRLIRSPTKSQTQYRPQEEEEDEGKRLVGNGSFLNSVGFRRANSFAPITHTSKPLRRILSTRKSSTPTPDLQNGDRQSLEPVDMNVDIRPDMQVELDTPGAGPSTPRSPGTPESKPHSRSRSQPESAKVAQPESTPLIFDGLRFLLLGEADSKSVQQAVQKYGGTIVGGDSAENVDLVIVRLVSGSPLFRTLLETASTSYLAKFRTECWLEKCLYGERIYEADEHVSYTPVSVRCPVGGAAKVFISFSGFDECEKVFMARLVRTLGFNHLPTFSKRASHLLCPSGEGLKYEKAKEWGIPVVNMSWVEEAKNTGTVPIVDEHLLPGQDPSGFKQKTAQIGQGTSVEHKKDLKGKGKATEDDLRMADITNAQSQDQEQSFEFKPAVTSTQRNPAPGEDIPPLAVPSLSKLSLMSPPGSFGNPNGLLGGPPATQLWQIPPPAESQQLGSETSPVEQSSDASPPVPTQPDSETEDEMEVSVPSRVNKGKGKAKIPTTTQSESVVHTSTSDPGSGPEVSLKRSATEANLQAVKKTSNGNIKGKAAGRGPLVRRKSQSASPTKVHRPLELDGVQAKALQDSLTNLLDGGGPSLLGKRRSEEGGDDAAVTGSGGRSKRPRGTRAKPHPEPVEDRTCSTGEVNELSMEFGGQPLDVEEEVREESVRVTYEDPVQRDEKRKLMKLFGSQDSKVEIVSMKPVSNTRKRTGGRKSTRRNAQ
uniref:BRCT domain-containing protein n=1 Tax=Moniliophthora roreri TaxID=221103 RepID=A0A0W0FKY3_MONRR